MARTAGIYCRISRDPLGTELGVARQRDDGQAAAERLGWTVGDVYVDNDRSAYSGKPRPEYDRLCADLKNGTIDAVIAWHPDRLHRHPKELNDFIDLVDATGAAIETVQGGSYDLTTAAGRLAARIVGDVARHESEHKSERLRRKHLELAERGQLAGGGPRPFGFEPDRVTIRGGEAALIRAAAERLLAGGTMIGILHEWAAAGVTGVTGVPMRPPVFRRMMTSGRICGWREHHGQLVAPAVWPAIVDRATVDRLRALFADPARRKNIAPRKYLLTGGIAVCGIDGCGAPLISRPKGDGRRCYTCSSDAWAGGCGKIRQLAEPFEHHVAKLLLVHLASDVVQRAVNDAGAAELGDEAQAELDRHETDLAELVHARFVEKDAVGRPLVDHANYLTARQRLEARIETARRRVDRVQLPVVLPAGTVEDLTELWNGWTFDQKRVLVVKVIERVAVGPAVKGRNFFDPDRVHEPEWRI